MLAQRYPEDYDGILAGAPANNRTHLHTNVLWFYRASRAAADSYVTSDKVNLITRSVVAACNVKSGGLATDAFLTDPRACDWDPASIQCAALPGADCLLPGQVQTARAAYEGPRNPRNGRLIYPGWIRGSENASELGWNSQQSSAEPPFGSLFKWAFGPGWLWPTYDFDLDMAAVDQLLAPILNANSADLGAFRDRGGKLLAYHGSADPIINPQDTINYYNRVLALQSKSAPLALKRTQQFFRLFIAPGVGHCSRGPGPNAFGNLFSASIVAPPPAAADAAHDVLLALIDWVEGGTAPERIIATKYVGDTQSSGVLMTRPLCPFPLFPKYSGAGDPNAAASFTCADGPAVIDRTAAPEYLQ